LVLVDAGSVRIKIASCDFDFLSPPPKQRSASKFARLSSWPHSPFGGLVLQIRAERGVFGVLADRFSLACRTAWEGHPTMARWLTEDY
jgi:hypothetical protein